MKFLVVFAVVLISASVRAQDAAGTDSSTVAAVDLDKIENNVLAGFPAEQAGGAKLPEMPLPVTQPETTSQAPTESAQTSTAEPASEDSIGLRFWHIIERIINGSETVPKAAVKAAVDRLNRSLYDIFDYKLILLSECPEMKNVDLGRFAINTAEKILKGNNPEQAISDGLLRMRNRILRPFGLMVVAKSFTCPNSSSA
ncbi:hypothetical protein QAD02_015158 [Eretmocerus hayati]|uniref:Uncharacterized protein n=1 Tax=Eretmocerus hayati TaxID=131215 RepID=A0ACC2P7F7_9HYME|nr:hypothetical protein QAD02_015158 [Eretmocerus hayati]